MRTDRRTWLTVPNILTFLRLIGSFILLFVEPLTPLFFVIYSIAGVTDCLDGPIARRMHCQSELGARLDSISDIVFYVVMILRLFPLLRVQLPARIWYFVLGILAVRCVAYLTAAVKYHCFASRHTWLNKLTGAMIFLVPYFMSLRMITGYCIAICVISGLASLEELLIHLLSGKYDPDIKSLLSFRKKAGNGKVKASPHNSDGADA